MVAQLEVEKPIAPPTQQTIEIGQVILMFPLKVNPKPYICQILRVDLESITYPKARECFEFGYCEKNLGLKKKMLMLPSE